MITFNRTDPVLGRSIPTPSQDQIEEIPNIRQASVEDAIEHGGPVLAATLSAMNLRGDRRHIIVDTKVHLLMPGWIPAIPGWHTDGVPRGAQMDPAGKGEPNLAAQADGRVTSPRYHLLVTGEHCPTRFLSGPINLDIPLDVGADLYKVMTAQVGAAVAAGHPTFTTPDSTVVEWDWWNVHTAQQASGRGWRLLVRVTETDHIPPRVDPRDFIRRQSMVFAPLDFGW